MKRTLHSGLYRFHGLAGGESRVVLAPFHAAPGSPFFTTVEVPLWAVDPVPEPALASSV